MTGEIYDETFDKDIFLKEGMALEKAGFKRPLDGETPEDFKPEVPLLVPIESTQPQMLSAWDEAIRLGIDIETYLEG